MKWFCVGAIAAASKPATADPVQEIRGITLAPIEDTRLGEVGYGTARAREALEEIALLGADWVSLTPFGRMENGSSTDIVHDFEIPLKENLKRLRATAEMARALNLKVALIPHVYVVSGEWRGDLWPGVTGDVDKWFDAYDAFIVRYAVLAREMDADLFSVGVEFKSTTNYQPERWRETIQLVRQVYRGPLTYSANWDEVEDVPFWDDVDLIGVNGFWPLARKPGDGMDAMAERTRDIADRLESLFVEWQRPVVFTEFGVKSARDAALAPWEWPEHCGDLVYDEGYQAAGYAAMFEAVMPRPWFAGLFIWKYISDPWDETQEEQTGFSPRQKSAAAVLSSWYHADWAGTACHPTLCESLYDGELDWGVLDVY